MNKIFDHDATDEPNTWFNKLFVGIINRNIDAYWNVLMIILALVCCVKRMVKYNDFVSPNYVWRISKHYLLTLCMCGI